MIVYHFWICITEKSPTGYEWCNEILCKNIASNEELIEAIVNAKGRVLEYRVPKNDDGLRFIYFFHTDCNVLSWFRNGMSAMWGLCMNNDTRPNFTDNVVLPENTFYDDFIKGINNG